MDRKIVRPSTQFVDCPECGAQGKVVSHTRGWLSQDRHEFLGSIRTMEGDPKKVKCKDCGHEFVLER